MTNNPFLDLDKVRRTGQRAILATVARAVGPSYRPPGGSAVITDDGRVLGAISGGCLESDVLEAARPIIAGGVPQLLDYDTSSQDDLLWGTGSGCGGRVQIMLAPVPDQLLSELVRLIRAGMHVVLETVIAPGAELGRRALRVGVGAEQPFWYSHDGTRLNQVIRPPTTLVVCGAGNDAQPLVRYAAAAGFRVVVADHRAALASPERFPEAEQIVIDRPEELRQHLDICAGSYAVLLTHQYHADLAQLKALLSRPVSFVGILGSRQRSRQLLEQCLAECPQLRDAARAVVKAPVGLDLGADGPEEIAFSIVAELLAHRNGRSGLPLSAQECGVAIPFATEAARGVAEPAQR